MILHMDLPEREYDIILVRGVLCRAGEYLNLKRKVLVVTDSGVPAKYAETLASASLDPVIVTIPEGEASKNTSNLELLCRTMLENGFTRSDCVVAVGGGVVGDLAGFAAAVYMRGIDFYNVPTTVLSQVDSSIGGKVAVDFCGVKNILGAFHQPKAVLIDPDTLKTLPPRQISNGLAEALKMSMTSDPELFDLFERGTVLDEIDTVIEKSLFIKKRVVEEDEKETGLRKILNFGHTLGHGIELTDVRGYLHGECVALGMIPMCAPKVRERLLPILKKLYLPCKLDIDVEAALRVASHDKKRSGADISVIFVEEIGSCEIRKLSIEDWSAQIRSSL